MPEPRPEDGLDGGQPAQPSDATTDVAGVDGANDIPTSPDGGSDTRGTGGGMAQGGNAGSTGSGGGGGPIIDEGLGGTPGGVCGFSRFDRVRQAIDLLVVLDRSASMQDGSDNLPASPSNPSKWDQVVPALREVIGAPEDAFSWGLKSFPEDGAVCANESVTAKIDVPVAAMNASAVNTAITLLTPAGNGTPTAAAIGVAADYLATVADGHPKYLLLVTDGAPGCTGRAGALTQATSGAAAAAAVDAVAAAAAAGIHTFVVGVATTSVVATSTLNMLAVAGLEARRDENPLATRFYLANTQTELTTALRTIIGSVVSCTLTLPTVAPVPPVTVP